MKRIIIFAAVCSCSILFSLRVAAQKTAEICLLFDKITNIDFRDHQYTLDFWCQFKYNYTNETDYIDFKNKLEVRESKNTSITLVDSSCMDNEITLLFKINCEMMQIWEVRDYPFDDQILQATIYLAGYNENKFRFNKDEHGIHMLNSIRLESGWKIQIPNTNHNHTGEEFHTETSMKDHSDISKANDGIVIKSIKVPADHDDKYSAISFQLDIDRENKWGLFFKLFTGMYAAILVAISALFINIKYLESRFGLAVGALFAAIANKYVIEGILPESPRFNLVDWLHTITFIAIIVVIYFSVSLLRMEDRMAKIEQISKRSSLIRLNEKAKALVLIPYAFITFLFVFLALYHSHAL